MEKKRNEYTIIGKEVHMQLTQGQVTVFDKVMLECILEHKWHAQYSPSINNFYAVAVINKKRTPLHREIMSLFGDYTIGKEIDHIDHDTLDNRKCNLRCVTHAENMKNHSLRSDNQTGYIGVSNYRTGKYKSSITNNGVHYYLGLYDCPVEAAKAYNKKAIELGFEMINNV
jgi:hypothetical protein